MKKYKITAYTIDGSDYSKEIEAQKEEYIFEEIENMKWFCFEHTEEKTKVVNKDHILELWIEEVKQP